MKRKFFVTLVVLSAVSLVVLGQDVDTTSFISSLDKGDY